jgi:hypothetical protein
MSPTEQTEQAEQTELEKTWHIAGWCKAIGVSQQLFYLWCRQGRGPHRVKLGSRMTIVRESPAAYLNRMGAESPAPAPSRPPRPPAAVQPSPAPKAATKARTRPRAPATGLALVK